MNLQTRPLPAFIAMLTFFGTVTSSVAAYAQSENYEYQTRAVIPKNQMLKFESFKNLILETKATSVETALPTLAQKFPDYLEFHTLMYNSPSVQGATFAEPRAIVFGPEASFVFTFAGSDHQMNGHAFETMEYSRELRRFLFREIIFKYPGFKSTDSGLFENEIEFENDKLIVSKVNPEKCTLCHVSASPIWMTYFIWPGAYGSNDDHLGMSFEVASHNPNNELFFKLHKKPSSQGRSVSLKPDVPDLELQGLANYAKAKPNHPRYKWLPNTLMEKGALLYANGTPYKELDFSAEAAKIRDYYKASSEWPSRRNLFLLTSLNRLNEDRLVARLEKLGLKDAFANPIWKTLETQELKDLSVAAKEISRVISNFKFRHRKPSLKQIEEVLRTNIKSEFQMQRERLRIHDKNLGDNVLVPQPYISDSADYDRSNGGRSGVYILDPKDFYVMLFNLSEWNRIDEMAATIETDNQFLITILEILLKDRGVELHAYSMTLDRELTFHTESLSSAFKFLGMTKR